MPFLKTIFCAKEQIETKHELTSSINGEIVATCSCGHSVKFPSGLTKEEFDLLVQKHKESNQGQVTQESIDENLSNFSDPE